jgi:hypothetical protein
MFYYDKSTSEYLKTLKGRLNRYNWRKLTGSTYYKFSSEPPGKNTNCIEKIEFQRKVLRKLKKSKKRAYRSRIAAEIDIYPTSQTPPHIHKASREMINLFEQPLKQSGITRKGLIYQNDNQIAYLSVRYNFDTSEKAIRAEFAPIRNFFEDLRLSYYIMTGDFDEFIDRCDLEEKINEIEGSREGRDFSRTMEKLHETERDKDAYIKMLGEKAYNAMLLMDKLDAQKALLNMSKLTVRDIHSVLNTSGIFEKSSALREISEIAADWVTNTPIKMQFPDIPTENNQTSIYKHKILTSLKKFKKQFSILYPLYTPVILEAIYKPPLASKSFYKDLDNIMGWFVPIFHDIFKPPPSHLSLIDPENIKDDDLKIKIQRLPKSVKYSVSGFEIIEIPRHQEDKSSGYVVIGIAPGSYASSSIRNRISKIIELAEDIYGWHHKFIFQDL